MPFDSTRSAIYKGKSNVTVDVSKSSWDTDFMFSGYGSKYSKTNGIFYAYTDVNAKVSQLTWEGVSVANKDALPTICPPERYSHSHGGRLMTKNIVLLSSSSDRTVYVYQNRVVDGSSTYYFDPNDQNARIHFVYMLLQAPGGNGGGANWDARPFEHHVSGSGGGGGACTVDLVRIPDDGYLSILIPHAPTVTASGADGGDVVLKYHSTSTPLSTLRTVRGGKSGKKPVEGDLDRVAYGGAGGTVMSPDASGIIENRRSSAGGDGSRNRYTYADSNGNTQRVKSGTSVTMPLGRRIVGDVSASLNPYPGLETLGGVDHDHVPGTGGSTTLGQGGRNRPKENGQSGSGYGSGGGGGGKQAWQERPGGAGAPAFICIGY